MPARRSPKLSSTSDGKLPFKVAFKMGGVVFAIEHFATQEEADARAASFDAEEPLYEGSSLTKGLAGKLKDPSRK